MKSNMHTWKTVFVLGVSLTLMTSLVCGFEETVFESTDGKMICTQNETNHQALVWLPVGKKREIIAEWQPSILESFKLPKGVFREGDNFAMLMFTASTQFEYWRYQRTSDDWSLIAVSPLSFSSGLEAAKFKTLTEFFFPNSKGDPVEEFQITDIPLVPSNTGDKRRLALLNGSVFRPRGMQVSGAIWDQPLEKILKDHEARKGAPSAESSKPSDSKPTPAEPQPTSPVSLAKPSTTQPSTKIESSSITLMIIGGVIVLGLAGLAYRLTRGRH